MSSHLNPHVLRRWRIGLAAAACGLSCLSISLPVQAQPVSNSSLYYRMGGGSPGGAAANGKQVANTLGLGGVLRLNYSCGKFDIGLSWQTMMNGFSQLGTQVTQFLSKIRAA